MAIKGRFNTDVEALKNRISAHSRFGSKDINEWIFHHLELDSGQSVLDLGCGVGKQSIPMAKLVGPHGSILSIDIAAEALGALMKEAAKEGIADRITPLNCNLDDTPSHLSSRQFDRALSAYALYYAQHPEIVINAVYNAMKDDGIFFFCGPSKDNNRELKAFHYELKGDPMPPMTGGALFMEDTGQQLARAIFRQVDIQHFENPLRFDSPEALYTYWSSYNLYDPVLDGAFRQAAEAHFRQNAFFTTWKRVLGVKAVK